METPPDSQQDSLSKLAEEGTTDSQWSPYTQANTRSSTLRSFSPVCFDPNDFPTPRTPPKGLPLRPLPQSPALAKLDAAIAPLSLNSSPSEDSNDDLTMKKALRRLEKNIKSREPYVQLASDRLHTVLGLRNESVFDLPETPMRISPTVIQGPSSGRVIRKKDSGLDLNGLSTPIPKGFHSVDKETGKGLREFLLQKGKEYGYRKRECQSISFHDLSSDIRTGQSEPRLLALYDFNGPSNRVDVYEVDLPTSVADLETGSESLGTETWLWILIQRPVLRIDPQSTVGVGIPEFDEVESPDVGVSLPAPPPNFPSPIPTSWVVFAAPLAHLTLYPEAIETPEEFFPFLKKFKSSAGGTKVQKRVDYDFSHSGIPLFEFSCQDLFNTPTPVPFLSVDSIGPYSQYDKHEPFTPEQFARVQLRFSDLCDERRYGNNRCGNNDKLTAMGIENGGLGTPSPYSGLWWRAFYEEMYNDASVWRDIKQAMGRGKCRVVLRWSEWEADESEDAEIKKIMEETVADINTGRGGPAPNLIIAPLADSAEIPGKRPSRGEMKRRSGLGVGDGKLSTPESDIDHPAGKKRKV